MYKAYLILILHAHMPYVMDIRSEDSVGERWLYEALSDCYLRLIQVFDRLIADKVPFQLTISLSPTLLAQWENPKMGSRFVRYLRRQIKLAECEICRTKNMLGLAHLPKMYKALYEKALQTFEDRCNGNLIKTFKSYQDQGILEIITCPATHPYLPALRPIHSGIRAQTHVAASEYRRMFGSPLSGLWLPECGYFLGLDQLLLHTGIKYTFLDTETIKRSTPIPKYGTYAPIKFPSGLVGFGRDVHTAKQVWSATDGYPGDYDYRDFYGDIGFEMDLAYLRPYLPYGERSYTGLKYYRIESKAGKKRIYEPQQALRKVSIHADDFLAHRLNQIRGLSKSMGLSPIICAFYDAELFGHWWFEGPLWIEMLFRKIAQCQGYLNLTTPSAYIKQNPRIQVAQPSSGSWGWKGHHEVWINSTNRWVYPHLFKASEKMEAMAQRQARNSLEERALNQAGKELMLAQSSDWTFILHNNTLTDYATRRIKEHIGRFWRLMKQIEVLAIDKAWLQQIEEQNNIFPTLSYRDFSAKDQ